MGQQVTNSGLPIRATRARRPKVKTGCVTCKVRRIKCDEQKPSCLRCISTGRTCGGYLSNNERTTIHVKKESGLRVLLPNSSSSSYLPSSSKFPSLLFREKKAIGRQTRLYQPARLLFTNEREYWYFHLFCNKVSSQLSGYYDTGIWSQIILQASEQDEAIRHAVVAIGALDMVLGSAKNRGSRQSKSDIDKHHQSALEEYSKAISQIRAATFKKSHSIRTILITCLLIYCFENLHGNFEAALAQVQGGIRLLEEWNKNLVPTNGSAAAQSLSPTPVPQPNLTFGIVSPAPSIIEDEIVQAFGRLDMQAASWVDQRPISYHVAAKEAGSNFLSQMPAKFTSITEARIYWELIMRRLMHFICSAHVPHARAPDGSRPSSPSPRSSSININANSNNPNTISTNNNDNNGLLNRNLNPSRPISPQAIHDQRTHLGELSRWHTAFSTLYAVSSHASPVALRSFPAGAIALQLRFLAARYAVCTVLIRAQTDTDAYLPVFREIVALARMLSAESNWGDEEEENEESRTKKQQPLFTFDLGFIAQLYVVTIKCRDRGIRREAIALLQRRPWREGVWDSLLAARMATAVVEIEEDGAGLGPFEEGGEGAELGSTAALIPEHARVMGTKVTFSDNIVRVATMKCFLRGTGPLEPVRIIKRYVRW